MKIGFSCFLPHPDGRPSDGPDKGRARLETWGHSLERTCAEPPEDVELSCQPVELEWQIPTTHLAVLP